MTKDHGGPEAGQLSRVWTRGRRVTRVVKERAAQRVQNCTVQCAIRSAKDRMNAGAAGKILNSADSRELRV